MGRRKNSHGQSRYTMAKESTFSMCLGYHIDNEARMLAGRRPYYHLDMNSGSGENHAVPGYRSVVGTPLLFMRKLDRHAQLSVRAFFYEKHLRSADQLRTRLSVLRPRMLFDFNDHQQLAVVHKNNALALHHFLDQITVDGDPRTARGSIISDPNGWSPKAGALDLAVATEVLRHLPNFMLLVSFYWGRAKAMRGYALAGEPGQIKNSTLRMIADYLPLRPYWLISKPAGPYVYLCGSSRPFPGCTQPGRWPLYSSTSVQGRDVIHYCDQFQGREKFTAAVTSEEHPETFRRVPKQVGFQ